MYSAQENINLMAKVKAKCFREIYTIYVFSLYFRSFFRFSLNVQSFIIIQRSLNSRYQNRCSEKFSWKNHYKANRFSKTHSKI